MTTPSHLVQGLNNDQVAADWPAIDAEEVRWLCGRFPQLGSDARVQWHSPRPLSAAALVVGNGGRWFTKRHHCRVRSVETLLEEHRYIAHLRAAGLPVVEVQQDVDGHSAVARGDWTWEMHAAGPGVDLYRDAPSWTPLCSLPQARAAGAMLARLHLAAAGHAAPQRNTHILVARDELIRSPDPIARLQAQLAGRPALADYLASQPWQQELREAVAPWQASVHAGLLDEPPLWAHNDWHASNLLWTHAGEDAGISHVFDFGLASPTSALFDLATAIERNAIAWLELQRGNQAVHAGTALALLAGYRSVRPLSAAQVRLLADLLPIVHLDFALSEVEYFHGITGSRANADVAYHDFLLGHARWFATPPGRALLATLRDAA